MKSPHPDSAVAIIGMGCRLPGAENLEEFWDLVHSGRTAWGPVPEERFNRRLYYDPHKGMLNKSYTDLAALVTYRPVDFELCPISRRDIEAYDLAHITLCEVAAAACRQAGLDPAALPHENTGVYIGHAAASGVAAELGYATYIAQTAKYLREAVGFEQLADGLGEQVIQEMIERVRREKPHRQPDGGPLLGASFAARLIAQTFALSGPCMSFNAACASSSQALVQGMRALQGGSIDMAIVGGASFFHSDTLVMFSQSQSVSPNGSHPFSAEADGMVVGEGYVVAVLKMLKRAVADKDQILAVLPAVGVSSDGHGKSLWAPRHEGQIVAIQRAYGPEVAMQDLQYIEAHATSTSLGDITEVKALSTALEGHLPPGVKLPIGSAKLNVGHTLEAAGLVGVIKTVLALQHGVIPPAIDARPLNPQIDWDAVPLVVPRQATAWPQRPDGLPRRAGADAFGIGGLNVHVVVDEFVPSTPTVVPAASIPTQDAASAASGADEGAVAIIGMGAVMPGARTLDAFWELLFNRRDPKGDVPADRWDADTFHQPGANGPWATPTTSGGYITEFEYDWRKHKIPPKQLAQASPLQFMILDAVDQAIHRSGYHERPFDRQRLGVVVGTVFGGEYAAQLVMGLKLPEFQETLADLLRGKGVSEELIAQMSQSYGEVLLKHMPALLDETGSFTASALASRITKSFDLMGGAVAVDAGQASALAALSCCVEQLRHGDCDMMICVGGERDMTPVLYEDWSIRGRLPVDEVRSPLDARADGTLPGEGCGALLLKRLADARRDGDPIYAILRGLGAAFDASGSRATRLAIQRAMEDARVSPAEVAVIETTPSGRAEVDIPEWEGMIEVYGKEPRKRPILLGTPVSQIGDMGGASGMASLLKAAMELETLEVPAEMGLTHPSAHLTRHASVLAVPVQPAPLAADPPERILAGIHSGGEGEVTYHVYLERGTTLNPVSQSMQRTSKQATTAPSASRDAAGRVTYFDATVRRREKMRQHAAAPQPQAPPASALRTDERVAGAQRSDAPEPLVSGASPTDAARQYASAASHRTQPSAPAVSPPAPQPAPVALAPPTEPVSLDPKELETFLINFVVEHTGYPPEIVELDVDLEADLGIDSIKKAQLFGELGEYFDVQPSEDLSLDDFPTLRHVLNFLVQAQGGTQLTSAPAPKSEVRVAGAETDRREALAGVAPETQNSLAPLTATARQHASAAGYPVEVSGASATDASRQFASAASHQATPVAPAPPPAPVAPAPPSEPVSLDPKELETFLVNFVVEHTGYPPEIVELDVDLEADLGIDSIKKAQLFGELGEYFDVQPSEDLSLDDFPTLRHVLDFLLQNASTS